MRKVLCVVFGLGLLIHPIASQEMNIKTPTLKRAAQRPKPAREKIDPKMITPPVKLSEAQLKTALQPQLKRPVAGVTDFLRLDARTTYVSGKGSLKAIRPSWHSPKEQVISFTTSGLVEVEFMARNRPTTYVVDFEFVCIASAAEFTASVGDSVSTTTVDPGRHHLLYLVEASGGAQVVEVRIDGFVGFKGVEVSILD